MEHWQFYIRGRLLEAFNIAAQKYQGFFIGTGYEYKMDFLPGLFWKTEYRYSSFDRERPAITVAAGGALFGFEESKKYVQTLRSELVYRFNWGGPVVAKY